MHLCKAYTEGRLCARHYANWSERVGHRDEQDIVKALLREFKVSLREAEVDILLVQAGTLNSYFVSEQIIGLLSYCKILFSLCETGHCMPWFPI